MQPFLQGGFGVFANGPHGGVDVNAFEQATHQLGGRIDIDEAKIEPELPGATGIVSMDVVEIHRPGGDPEETEQKARGPQIGMDIALRSTGGKVRVSGRGLNVILDVNARVRGTIARAAAMTRAAS